MDVETTKRLAVTVEEIEQALAEWLSGQNISEAMNDSVVFKFYLEGDPVDSEPCVLGGVEVIIKEQQ